MWVTVAALVFGGYAAVGVIVACLVARPGTRADGSDQEDQPEASILAGLFWPLVLVCGGLDRLTVILRRKQ